MVEPEGPQMTIRRMFIVCWITKATDNTQNMYCLFLFDRKNGYANAPECYVYTYIACRVVLFSNLCSGPPVAVRFIISE
jgi:hypothetical protein